MYDAPRSQRTANSRVGPSTMSFPRTMVGPPGESGQQFFAALSPVPEQVIAVPKILPHEVPPRRLCRDTQLAEQLVEVPTILYFLKQRIPEQIDDIPVPHGGRGASGGLQGFLPGHSSLKRTANKIADLPAPGSGVRRLQGFLPEQNSTATSSSSLERISERNVEQIVVSRVGEGLQDFLPGQSSSSSSHDPARGFEALDEPGDGVFRTFPIFKKVRHNLRTQGRHCLRTRAHGRRLLMTRPWCSRRRKRRRRSPRTSLSSLSSTCSTMGVGVGASGTQLTSGIAGGWPLPMGLKLAILFGGLHGSSAAGHGDDATMELLCWCLVRQWIHVPALTYYGGASFSSSSKWWTLLLFTETGTHSSHCARSSTTLSWCR